jgi:hypothetical protein
MMIKSQRKSRFFSHIEFTIDSTILQLLVDTQRDGQEKVLPNFEGLVSGALLDGFGSGSFGDIVGQITSITGGEGGKNLLLQ